MQGKTLVTGAAGQLGGELCRLLGPRAIATDIDTLDLTDGPAVGEALARWRPAVVINCAAYTRVDQAESEAGVVPGGQCHGRRTPGRGLLAAWTARWCRSAPITCSAVPAAAGRIGRPTRRRPRASMPEQAGRRTGGGPTCPAHLIVRTCGLYARPSHARAANFVKTILRLARSRRQLRVVADQHCTPSYVPHVARAFLLLLLGTGSARRRPPGASITSPTAARPPGTSWPARSSGLPG